MKSTQNCFWTSKNWPYSSISSTSLPLFEQCCRISWSYCKPMWTLSIHHSDAAIPKSYNRVSKWQLQRSCGRWSIFLYGSHRSNSIDTSSVTLMVLSLRHSLILPEVNAIATLKNCLFWAMGFVQDVVFALGYILQDAPRSLRSKPPRRSLRNGKGTQIHSQYLHTSHCLTEAQPDAKYHAEKACCSTRSMYYQQIYCKWRSIWAADGQRFTKLFLYALQYVYL